MEVVLQIHYLDYLAGTSADAHQQSEVVLSLIFNHADAHHFVLLLQEQHHVLLNEQFDAFRHSETSDVQGENLEALDLDFSRIPLQELSQNELADGQVDYCIVVEGLNSLGLSLLVDEGEDEFLDFMDD